MKLTIALSALFWNSFAVASNDPIFDQLVFPLSATIRTEPLICCSKAPASTCSDICSPDCPDTGCLDVMTFCNLIPGHYYPCDVTDANGFTFPSCCVTGDPLVRPRSIDSGVSLAYECEFDPIGFFFGSGVQTPSAVCPNYSGDEACCFDASAAGGRRVLMDKKAHSNDEHTFNLNFVDKQAMSPQRYHDAERQLAVTNNEDGVCTGTGVFCVAKMPDEGLFRSPLTSTKNVCLATHSPLYNDPGTLPATWCENGTPIVDNRDCCPAYALEALDGVPGFGDDVDGGDVKERMLSESELLDCRLCVCCAADQEESNGECEICDSEEPDPRSAAGMGGDPHVKKWSNEYFDFHGQCDLVLLDAPSFDNDTGLAIHVQTEIRHDYSYIKHAAVAIGTSDESDVLIVSGWGQYMINEVSAATLPYDLAGKYSVTVEQKDKNQAIFTVDLGDGQKLHLKTFKDWVSISLDNASKKHFGDSKGLMGQFGTGAMLSRDGTTVISDPNEFGQHYQVLDTEPKLFPVLRPPQHPQEACIMPKPVSATGRRRLGETVALEAAEKACAHWGDDAHKEICVADVMMSGDLEVAQAGAF